MVFAMSVFRHVRRLVLCLIVGVTAFGVAGWLLRPKPIWITKLLPESSWEFVSVPGDLSDQDPIWLYRMEADFPDQVVAISPANGEIEQVTRIPVTVSPNDGTVLPVRRPVETVLKELRQLPSGVVMIVRSRRRKGGETSETEFHYVRRAPDSAASATVLEGDWNVSADGDRAWSFSKGSGGIPSFWFADPISGKRLKPLHFGPEYSELNSQGVSFSPDLKLLAVPEGIFVDRDQIDGVELWDVASSRMIKRITPPISLSTGARSQSTSFECAGKVLRFEVVERRKVREPWIFRHDVEAERFVADWKPDKPAEEGELTRLADHDEVQCWLWLKNPVSEDAYFAVYRRNKCVVPWRRLPFTLATLFGEVSKTRTKSFEVRFASAATSFVARTRDYPFLAVTPSGIANAVPQSLGLHSLVERVYWHDMMRDEWRDVGCWNIKGDFQLRTTSLVTIARDNEGGPVLQSWALPPKDSRWRAATYGAASFVSAWLLSAWIRSRRRIKPSA